MLEQMNQTRNMTQLPPINQTIKIAIIGKPLLKGRESLAHGARRGNRT
ncbi:MAG: hypothetical protein LC802_14135 [Acidobacteria bacterium]|nr:hypothetical protein [Acidobacteriota bacterium]